jgi:PhnB protein
MKLELFINFDGNCREAVEFYAKVFRSEVGNLMTYADAPPDPNYTMPEADRNKIMYAGVPIGDMTVMFMDMPTGWPLAVGNNINPTINVDDKAEVVRIFNELKVGGKVHAEPAQTFYSELYCMVEDKFGIIWHVMYYVPEA